MSEYAFIVCADIRYLVEVTALLNSLDYVGNKQDVHFYGYMIPEHAIFQFDKLCYKVIFHKIEEEEIQKAHGLSEVVCRKRYFYAAQVGKDYKSVCVLDADMIFVRNPENYFKIAETGLIACAVKEQKQSYNDPHHQFKGEWLMPEGFTPEMDLCNCPLFIDAKAWAAALVESYLIFVDGFPKDNFKGPDMAAMNLMLCRYGSEGKTIGLPNVQWIASNEQALKPYQRFVGDYGKIKTETGTPVYSIHGHIGHVRWREVQLDNRHRCAQGYLKAEGQSLEASDSMARGAMDMIYGLFKHMFHYKIKIKKLNYRHPENDAEHEYGDLWND